MSRTIGLITLAALLIVTGCARSHSAKFPYGRSIDRHNFMSTPDMPLSVSIKDTISGEELLRVDVPVYKQLILDFEHKHDWTPAQTPGLPAEYVTWQVVDAGRLLVGGVDGKLKNRMDLRGNPVIVKVDIRDHEPADGTPEYPSADDTPGDPVAPPDQPDDPQPQPRPAAEQPTNGTPRGPAVRTYPKAPAQAEPDQPERTDDEADQPDADARTPVEDQAGEDLDDALD